MQISAIDVFPVHLPMLQSFSISGGKVGDKNAGAPHVYVKVTTDDGIEGWGEARPSHRWSYETIETVVTTINNYFVDALKGVSIFALEEIHYIMDKQIASGITRGQPIAKAAIDMAVLDAIAKTIHQPIVHSWFTEPQNMITLSYLISVSNEEEAAEKARIAKAEGYSGVDVKIGINPGKDLAILKTIKEILPDVYFRVDANQAYHLKDAMRLCKGMEEIGISVFEQPLVAGDLIGHAKLREFTTIPIALDESIWTPADVVRAIQLSACDMIVIKVTKMGGLSRAKRCGDIAKAAGLELLGGGLTESSLGLYASAHLFQALDIATPVDLNGPLFLADDPSKEMAVIQEGKIQLPKGNGIGWIVDKKKLKQYSITV
ncbi:mandelate racemase/muconate lactonizing enzyme family protein [Oceanobacillus chungangensis]|uniref:Mandelate racemase n=1 Tax=Oceanobacillus chungangensis TaxID=1229152 RepID=A0A3D8PXZ7_9BACI|nr:enolase C-terminal domain-like protein [Oceanobacillus chungangensis]RDW20652.1 mandelate racemase [Oceanobacillus chungangensis]